MLRRLLRILLPAGLIVGVVVLVRRTVALRDEVEHLTPSADRWTPLPEPPPAPAADTPAADAPAAHTPAAHTPATDTPAADTPAADAPAAHTPAAHTPAADTPAAETPAPVWVEANEDGSVPPTHPIKAKAASRIYHLPGMVNYARTKPDRCYADEAAAAADGFTRAKR